MAHPLTLESVWYDKYRYDDAERQYIEYLNRDVKADVKAKAKEPSNSSLIDKIALARQQIKQSLQSGDVLKPVETPVLDESENQYQNFQKETIELKKVVSDLQIVLRNIESRVSELEKCCLSIVNKEKPALVTTAKTTSPVKKEEPKVNDVNGKADDDDDIDLFGSDEGNEADKLREERLKAYQDKKSKKPQVIAKSSIVLDVKPWDDETDMKEMERQVRKIEMDGLVWGASKLVPLAYGIHKLQIVCVVEDEKVSVDLLQETIEEIEDLVQSVDIAAFNKI